METQKQQRVLWHSQFLQCMVEQMNHIFGKKDSKRKSLTPFEQIWIPDDANASEDTVSIKSTHIVSKNEEDKYHLKQPNNKEGGTKR